MSVVDERSMHGITLLEEHDLVCSSSPGANACWSALARALRPQPVLRPLAAVYMD